LTRLPSEAAGRRPSLAEPRDAYRIPAWVALKVLHAAAPPSLLFRLSGVVGSVRFMSRSGRDEALKRLERRLGDTRSADELRRIARRHFEFVERNAFLKRWPRAADAARKDCLVEGLDRLDSVLADGNGAIVVTGHFGYARLIKPVLGYRGYKVWLVGRGMREPAEPSPSLLGTFVHTRLLGLPPRRWASAAMGADLGTEINLRPHLAALKRNEVLILLVDSDKALARRQVEVLGRRIWLASGAMSIARSTGAPVLPVFVVEDSRRPGLGLRMEILAPLELQRSDDAGADLEANLARFAATLQRYIEIHPHLWQHWTSGWRKGRRRRKSQIAARSASPAGERLIRSEGSPPSATGSK
jgi:lauroyl/myristoyl acyltransferase